MQEMMPLKAAAVAACALLLWSPLAVAFPKYWYDSLYWVGEVLPGEEQCDAHPTEEVPGLSPHGSPVVDSSIGFIFYEAASNIMASFLCPGSTYIVKVSFSGVPCLALLTANNASRVAFSVPLPTAGCPNRVDLGGSVGFRAASSFNATFNVPCSSAGQSMLFKVTSANRVDKQWKWNSVSLDVRSSSACAATAAACGLSSGPSSPPSPRSPPSPQPLSSPPFSPQPFPTPLSVSPPKPSSLLLCTPSNLGYQCMEKQGKITVHWTVNSSAAPANNGCTPTKPTVLSAFELAQNGTLHMAVEAAVTGYVAIAFAEVYDFMYPADIVMGWFPRNGSRFIDTFYVDDEYLGLYNKYPQGSPSWAYDKGVFQQQRDGSIVTTICFSRRLVDYRARVSPIVKTDGNPAIFNWAISAFDDFVQHSVGNAGGFYLNLARGKAPPSPPPQTSPLASPPSPPSPYPPSLKPSPPPSSMPPPPPSPRPPPPPSPRPPPPPSSMPPPPPSPRPPPPPSPRPPPPPSSMPPPPPSPRPPPPPSPRPPPPPSSMPPPPPSPRPPPPPSPRPPPPPSPRPPPSPSPSPASLLPSLQKPLSSSPPKPVSPSPLHPPWLSLITSKLPPPLISLAAKQTPLALSSLQTKPVQSLPLTAPNKTSLYPPLQRPPVHRPPSSSSPGRTPIPSPPPPSPAHRPPSPPPGRILPSPPSPARRTPSPPPGRVLASPPSPARRAPSPPPGRILASPPSPARRAPSPPPGRIPPSPSSPAHRAPSPPPDRVPRPLQKPIAAPSPTASPTPGHEH
ncbi:hypothetical protein VaNZ11_009633 [Volvox africanus]|uniref:Pherophorin domain-containing protein n=1 Tax=Volvox africanus TaxID=51714 RepID=A0ABQ5S7R7_9CHLO|nr:hypothetical protein VaNZ11_009633 [Volvox africanus]